MDMDLKASKLQRKCVRSYEDIQYLLLIVDKYRDYECMHCNILVQIDNSYKFFFSICRPYERSHLQVGGEGG